MFLVTVGTQSFVYTVSTLLDLYISSAISILLMQGDYNMTPDRHLGSVRLSISICIAYLKLFCSLSTCTHVRAFVRVCVRLCVCACVC